MAKYISLVFILIGTVGLAQGSISLGKPITTPSINSYEPGRLVIELLPQPRIEVVIVSATGRTEVFNYPCQPTQLPLPPNPCTTDTLAEVSTLIGQLNTANLSVRNLWRRVFDRLIIDFPSRFPDGATVQ